MAGLQSSTTLHCSSSKSDQEAKIYAVLVGIDNAAAEVQMTDAWFLEKSLSPPEQFQMSLFIKEGKKSASEQSTQNLRKASRVNRDSEQSACVCCETVFN